MLMKYDMITILGPTASGKTSLAAALAACLKTEIISGDSRQVYRRMDLGTGKDLDDYQVEGYHVPFHLIDISGTFCRRIRICGKGGCCRFSVEGQACIWSLC